MRIAHLADLHLGFRQFNRTTARGFNQREADVTLAWRRAVADVCGQRPDLIVVAGDIFHSVRPTNAATLAAFQGFQSLRSVCPHIVVVAGNHDTPRSTDAHSILPLFHALGVHVAIGPLPEMYEMGGVRVTAVPSAAAARFAAPRPQGHGVHVLVMHAATPIAPGILDGGWDYVALGDYHVLQSIAPRVWYPGAIEYTSSNPWGERDEELTRALDGPGGAVPIGGKGWILYDTEARTVDFRRIEPPRRFLDLAPIDGAGLTAQQLMVAIMGRLEPADIEHACVRLVVRDVPLHLQRDLDWPTIRTQKARALELQLDFRRPEVERSTFATRQAKKQSLNEIVGAFMGERFADHPDRAQILRLSDEALAAADQQLRDAVSPGGA